MPSRREMIRMSDQEVWEFVAGQKKLQLATLNEDGSPHLTTLWFAIVDGDIVLETFTKSRKAQNLLRDQRMTALLEDGDVYEELRGAMLCGHAELRREVEEVHRLHVEVLRRNTDHDAKLIEEASRSMAPKKIAIILKPENIISWDHRKLDVAY